MQSPNLPVRVLRHLRLVSISSSTCAVSSRGKRPQPARSYHLRAVQHDAMELAPGQVDVWWLQPEKVADPGLLQTYMQLLTKPEQAYVREGSSKAVQKERLLARTLQRTTLAKYCSGCPSPPSLRFERNPHGKPRLSFEEAEEQPYPPLHFSLTHTSTMLGIAVSSGSLVGLDVEETRRHTRADPLKLARRRLAPLELADLEAIGSKTGRAKRFVQLWTLKEAYVKAVGQGISVAPGLKGFSILLQPDSGLADQVQQLTAAPIADTAYRIAFQSEADSGDTWGFMLLSLTNEHTAAVCLQTSWLQPQLARQDSSGSNSSSDTVFNSHAFSTLTDTVSRMHKGHTPSATQSISGPIRFTLRGTVPLVTDDVELMCCVDAIGGF